MIVYTKQKLTHRHRKETGDYQRVEGVGKKQMRPQSLGNTLSYQLEVT